MIQYGSSAPLNPLAAPFIPGATHHYVPSPFFARIPLEIRQRIYGEVWSGSPVINIGGLRCTFPQNSKLRLSTQSREPGTLGFEELSHPKAAKYPLWFMVCKAFYVESLAEAHRIGTANFEPRRAIGGWDQKPDSRSGSDGPQNSTDPEDSTLPKFMRIQYSPPEFSPWLFRTFKIPDFLRTEEWIAPGTRNGIVLVSSTSLQELQILLFVPAMRTPRVQILELRILIEVLPASREDYTSYSFNFASLEWLCLPTIREVRISLDFVKNANRHTHRRTIRTKREHLTQRTKKAAVIETQRLANKILEGHGQAPRWERTFPPDDVGQGSWLLIMQKKQLKHA